MIAVCGSPLYKHGVHGCNSKRERMRTMQLLQALAFDTKDAHHNSDSPLYVIVLKGEGTFVDGNESDRVEGMLG